MFGFVRKWTVKLWIWEEIHRIREIEKQSHDLNSEFYKGARWALEQFKENRLK